MIECYPERCVYLSKFEFFSGSTMNTITNFYREVVGVFEERSGWIVLFIGLAIGLAGGLIILKLREKTIEKNKSRLIQSTLDKILTEKNKSEAILNDLDVGIAAYGSDGSIMENNPAFLKIMEIQKAPENYKEFLMFYGKENGLVASSMLGKKSFEGIYTFSDKIVRIRIKSTKLENEKKFAKIIVIQDITRQENEDKRRKEFVANVSHELKTPLTTIKTYSESLLDWGLKEKKKDSVRKDVDKIHEDAIRMGSLVEDLLLLSSIDSNEMRPEMQQYNLNQIVRSVADRMQVQAKEKNIRIACYSMRELPLVFINKSSIERIIINILSNAIKYTEKKGEISIYLGVLVDDVYVKIADTGFGIEKENLKLIFNRFYRVDMTGSRMYGGTGLGLSIAKELAEIHGGDITVKSELGKGSEFVLRIPFASKIFTDAADYIPSGPSNSDIVYRVANEYLLSTAAQEGIETTDLSSIPKEEMEKIMEKVLTSKESPA